MTDDRFRLDLEGGQTRGDEPRFVPGARLAGRFSFMADRDLTVTAVTATVRWMTSGKGDREEGVAWTQSWPLAAAEQAITAGMSLQRTFECTLPTEPWSYTGTIVSIGWEAIVSLDVPWATDPSVVRRFTLRP